MSHGSAGEQHAFWLASVVEGAVVHRRWSQESLGGSVPALSGGAMSARRVVGGLVVAALLVSAGVVAVVHEEAAKHVATTRAPVSEAPDTEAAMVAARAQGSPVEVANLRTETRAVYAKPDGTMTAELSTRPVRVRLGSSWVGTDTSLVRRPDGSIGPKSVAVDLSLSPGGSRAPLLRFGRDGKLIELSWRGRLPAPRLSGDTATYAEVLRGVDLVVRAEVDGYAQYLVMKDARAAKSPAVAKVRLGLRSTGVRLRVGETGAVEVRDAAGKVRFVAPPSQMWDSSIPARRAVAKVMLDGHTLTVVPDRELLTDPKVHFPLVVDPDMHTLDKTGWTTVYCCTVGLRASTHWNGYNSEPEIRPWLVGKVTARVGYQNYEAPVLTAQSFFQYDTGFLAGKRLLGAVLNTEVVYGPSCGNWRNHQLFASGQIGPGTNWDNAPRGGWLETRSVDSEYTTCQTPKPVGFTATAGIHPGGVSTFYIRAEDESDASAWRKYNPDVTRLSVNFNTAPNAPSALGTDPPLPAPCRWCGGTRYIGGDSIRLLATLSDQDSGDLLRPIWDIYGGAPDHRDVGPSLISGSVFSTTVDLSSRQEQSTTWSVRPHDGTDSGPVAYGPAAFIPDNRFPANAPAVSALLYQQDNRWHGGVGVPDAFTFKANGVTDVDHYLYGWSRPPATSVDADALGGKAVVTLTPPGDGPRDLFVQSVDRAENKSPTAVYHFYVRAGNGPLAQWSFEGNARDDAFLGDRDGTLIGGVTYGGGAVGSAVRLDGTGAYVTAPNTVRTDVGFSVMAWVRLERGDVARAVVSQDGTVYAGFDLWYRPENGGKWVFGMANADAGLPGVDMAVSTAPAQLNTWTQLTGVFDATSRQLRLYVNGVLSGTAARTVAGWNAAGPLRIGRTLWFGGATDYWPGSIDEVAIYDRVLSDAEVRDVVGQTNVQVGYWKFDDDPTVHGVPNRTARNEVPDGDMGVLSNGATFTSQGAVNGAVSLDGVDDVVSTNGPAVRTDQSFSVAAWVRLAQADTAPHAAVSQDGTSFNGFTMGYRPENGGRWAFGMPNSDLSDASTDVAWSAAPAQANTWTHLTGVYDAPSGQLRLYVDGVSSGTAARTVTSWNATGPLRIGRTMRNGMSAVDFWSGSLDEVRAYSRVISDEEIRGIVSRASVTLGSWKLDGNADDTSGRVPPLQGTLNGGPEWTGGQTNVPDQTDLAVKLNGTSAHVSAPHAVDVDRSYSVTAWAKLDRIGGLATVVSQDGNRVSAFKLRATADGHWSFITFSSDDPTAGRDEVIGTPVQVGVWTHLAATYDASGHRLALYVNGVLAGTKAHTQTWNYPAGGLQIGRAWWNSAAVAYLPGAIDDVAVYSRVLFADEIRALAGRDQTLVHNWRLDEPSGSYAADAVGSRDGTLSGGVSHVPGKLGNAIGLDGVNDSVSTTGVDVRTDTSFTVAAWVWLNDTCDPGGEFSCKLDAVSLDGDQTSKFRLGHLVDSNQNALGAWVFEMPESDGTITKASVSTEESELNAWVQLVGVYDASTHQLWLYVNAGRQSDGTLNDPWSATGGLQIGRGKVNGARAEFWPGKVDDVRLYAGALDKVRIENLRSSYPAQGGPATLPTADAGYWKFDENAGTTAADSSGRAMTATLQGGAGWQAGGRKGPALWLNGTTAYAETAGPVLNTAQSFSVAAWVYRTQGGVNRTVVAQDGGQASSFLLQYHPASDRWRVVVPGAVDRNDPTSVLLTSIEPALLGRWTHLAVAYDANLEQLRLYVNGRLSAAQVGVTVQSAGGKLSIGRARWNGGNVDYFPGGIDDVRAFGRALSDGEIRKVYDDVYAASYGFWRFDDQTVRDYSSRGNPTTAAGAVSYTGGVSGQALQLDGTGSATAQWLGADTRDSLTVSAWAKLTRNDRVQTVLGQDGARMGGFMLQYRPSLDRWVFAAPAQDADGAELVYAHSAQPPTLGRWTHLAGVYDHAAGQLRLYVDGELVGSRNGVTLWAADGGFTIGRGRYNGAPGEFFTGAVDEVRVEQGMASDDQIALRASWPAPAPGQLGSFVNPVTGDHYTRNTSDPVRAGYRFEGSLGTPVS